eukprot:scaffold760_cov372-Prasinococcus_capsulatus_cf.AAC.7
MLIRRTATVVACVAADASADASSYLWGRHYVFQHENRPLAVIYEAFSPAFEEWLVSGGRGARTR